MRFLLIAFTPKNTAETVLQHVHSFGKYSEHSFELIDQLITRDNEPNLRDFDGIVVHYSIIASHDDYLPFWFRKKIRRFGGIKAIFVQDDYRFIDATVDAIAFMKMDALFGLVREGVLDQIYAPHRLPGVMRLTVLAGYVDDDMVDLDTKSYDERLIDVGYRARKLPMWLGSLAREKWQIAEVFQHHAQGNLTTDISCREEDRIYGDEWRNFVRNCRAMLGTESGSSVCDFSGEIQAKVERYAKRHPAEAFENVRRRFFEKEDGAVVFNVISPRCFEAAAHRTLQILYPGEYNFIMEPWVHYVPFNPDGSNIEEVISTLKNEERWRRIVDRAHHDLVASGRYSYRAMVQLFDETVGAVSANRSTNVQSAVRPVSDLFEQWKHHPLVYELWHLRVRRAARWLLQRIWRRLPIKARAMLRSAAMT